jgi:vacuolar-type H+-ATPase subunit I/STV1
MLIIKIAFVFGGTQITLGIILNIVNKTIQRDRVGVLGGAYGIAGLVFYLGFISLVFLSGLSIGRLTQNLAVIAVTLAAQTVLGSAKMILETGEHPAKLKDLVATPSGTTVHHVSPVSSFKAAKGAPLPGSCASSIMEPWTTFSSSCLFMLGYFTGASLLCVDALKGNPPRPRL